MLNLWTLGGLSLSDLLRRTARESWRDDVFGQGGRMAFYHFLAIFPSLLVFFTISARVPHLGDHMRNALQDLSGQVLPNQVSQLLQKIMGELNQRNRSVVQLISICAGALWAALNGTWAMIYGLNNGLRSGRASLLVAIGGHHFRPDAFSGGHRFHCGVPDLLGHVPPGFSPWRRHRPPHPGMADPGTRSTASSTAIPLGIFTTISTALTIE